MTLGIASRAARGTTVALLTGLAMIGCGSQNGTPTSASTPTATPKGPPAAQFTIGGGAAITDALVDPVVSCSFPSLDGPTISVSTRSPQAPLYVRVTISAGSVTVGAGAGSGTSSTGRSFKGSGVTAFNADTGAQVNSTLSEVQGGGSPPGTIPAITAIAGRVDCGNLVPGSSTVTVSGTSPGGPVDGMLSPVHVACYTGAQTSGVQEFGLATVSGNRVAFLLFIRPDGFTIAYEARTQSAYYVSSTGSVETVTGSGGQVTGDATASSGGVAYTLHASGSATCGSTVPG